jgi:NAD(P)-dependent dehydrogenase (short-subunit alcohol dehydrogenase family)
LALAARGAAVVVNDVGGSVEGRGTSDAADAVVAEITRNGGRAVANRDSVAVRASAQAMVEQAVDEFGSVDIVVANAGIERDHPYDEYEEQDWHDMIAVHLSGSFWITQAAYRVMKSRQYGRVVFTTSGSGVFGRANSPGYVAVKAGIVGLMNSLAIEGAPHNVRANAVGPIAYTRMTSPHFGDDFAVRMRPELVSAVVVYLASQACALTHHVIEAGLGTYARIFVARASGWSADPTGDMSAETVADHLDAICDTSRFVTPMSSQEDIAEILGGALPS